MSTNDPTPLESTADRPYTIHFEAPEHGGARYIRCRDCCAELVTEPDGWGWETLAHRDGCRHADR